MANGGVLKVRRSETGRRQRRYTHKCELVLFREDEGVEISLVRAPFHHLDRQIVRPRRGEHIDAASLHRRPGFVRVKACSHIACFAPAARSAAKRPCLVIPVQKQGSLNINGSFTKAFHCFTPLLDLSVKQDTEGIRIEDLSHFIGRRRPGWTA